MAAPRLAEYDPFAHFAGDQLAALEGCAREERGEVGRRLFRRGEPPGEIYVLHSGSVAVRRETRRGPIVLARIGRGELVGELGFVDGRARSEDAFVERPCAFSALSPRALERASEADPRFALAFEWSLWKGLSSKLRGSIDHLTRFFPEGDAPPPRRHGGGTSPAAQRGIEVRRGLFEEQTLPAMEIAFLSTLSREERFAAEQTIFEEGESGENLYVVLEGRVVITKHIPGAGQEALAILGRGEFFGEMALIDQRPRTATATAHEEGAVVLAISREVLSGILDIERFGSVRLLRRLSSLAAQRLREIDEKLVGWYAMAGEGHGATPPILSSD